MKRLTTLLAILTLLAGCAAKQPRELMEGQGNPAQWQAHKVQISQIDGWQITGKLGLKTPEDSGSATLQWLQRQSYFDIRLSGPLGQGASRLIGRPGATELTCHAGILVVTSRPDATHRDDWLRRGVRGSVAGVGPPRRHSPDLRLVARWCGVLEHW